MKTGYVPKAIYKEGIGDIDFIWGYAGPAGSEAGAGFAHIIRRREEQGKDGYALIKMLPYIIKNGNIKTSKQNNIGSGGRQLIEYENKELKEKYRVIIEKSGNDNWLLSAMYIL